MNNDKSDPHIELYWHYNTIGLERMIKQPHRTHMLAQPNHVCGGLNTVLMNMKNDQCRLKLYSRRDALRPTIVHLHSLEW